MEEHTQANDALESDEAETVAEPEVGDAFFKGLNDP